MTKAKRTEQLSENPFPMPESKRPVQAEVNKQLFTDVEGIMPNGVKIRQVVEWGLREYLKQMRDNPVGVRLPV